ncbi:MAG: tRNA (guanosine(37)-N1)-methyltransferase TrmD [Opitutales bacterium]|jgi:tRNA (guanine37-N1)-methyltransferase|nr:tRNA (guanosine(37)-N1)-methyltransferase TrmD [Opitutales bacterium]MDP4644449.1 tRNA (guanosine(37)-N1)-methyltransferase TrmD [Opitutales bacterium]MDP4777297.1 tRNA (guanosine(37)-N1)-methyltransferase TrmD [Opitutales bacterium]MDP4883520.1 tRNA (guanosine(37)-N1)-methyltransferase TrmD [Opitutales bacterium]MDP5079995.1 tRNA (guanosine(37)-N1)-methyltransferase TrmD [Opitutales bacterium]
MLQQQLKQKLQQQLKPKRKSFFPISGTRPIALMHLEFDILTLFPEMVEGFLTSSMIGRGQRNGLIRAEAHQLRDWATDKHHKTDEMPFGGGAGMVMKPEPIFAAVEQLRKPASKVIYMAPDGEPLTSQLARELVQEEHLIILSGHYEGVDQRVRDHLIDREVSIGDYVLTNGTLAAAVLIDCVSRFIPGFLGDEKSLTEESFMTTLLGFPQYTRPADYRGMCVPEVLLSGDHGAIAKWRREQQIEKTRQLRPDILDNREFQ